MKQPGQPFRSLSPASSGSGDFLPGVCMAVFPPCLFLLLPSYNFTSVVVFFLFLLSCVPDLHVCSFCAHDSAKAFYYRGGGRGAARSGFNLYSNFCCLATCCPACAGCIRTLTSGWRRRCVVVSVRRFVVVPCSLYTNFPFPTYLPCPSSDEGKPVKPQ